ncbi:ABC transporter substrate-binding protein [Arthrobacter sp. NIO-1057]|uniref:ABC transporter substrate-binding protein n=1 Tax=Arthrobacter sp. NIO-1057 TaxID=993071 RepID=UPI00071CA39D|nr:iron-siderophore ABC transporter substrate-binding protein [Arthrobacter sp. NIO-1057]KSU65939.1 iron-siderophore ABC transporter substrate-binding protein [Arthrobacter sp. NIO-1057]SCC28065.1 iron complex transport system substrate-binding protein [Arthrobacter sp. NIO-1057]
MRFRELRSLTLIASLAVAALTFTGCTAESSAKSTDSADSAQQAAVSYNTPRTMPEGKGSGEADGVFPRTVVHFAGQTELKTEPKKVVVISTGQADAVMTLGIVPTASTAAEGAGAIPQYLVDAFPDDASELKKITDVGSRVNPDIETIANIKPDLILMNEAGKDPQALYKSLSAVAPTVVTQGTGRYWKQDFLLLADALGKTEQAQTWLDEYQTDAQSFGQSVQGEPTISFLRKSGDRTRVYGVASFTGSVAEDAGLKRPETQQFTDDTSVDISSEQLDQADGDWIFYSVQGGNESELTDLALWPTLNAVANKQTVSVDDDAFYLNVGPTAARSVLNQLKTTLSK